MKEKEELNLAAGCLSVVAAGPILILRGLVFARLWHWFVVPLGIAGVSEAHAIGLMVLVAIIQPLQWSEHEAHARYEEKNGVITALFVKVVTRLIVPSVCLLAGWVAHLAVEGGW